MKTVKYKNFSIKIENPKGSIRSGIDYNGKPWKTKMNHPYGFFVGVKGKDKDELDVFLGKNLESEKVFIINQIIPTTGKFDEHKVLVGFDSKEEAKKAYLSNYNDDATKRIGSLKKLTLQRFNEWLEENKMKVSKQFVKSIQHIVIEKAHVAEHSSTSKKGRMFIVKNHERHDKENAKWWNSLSQVARAFHLKRLHLDTAHSKVLYKELPEEVKIKTYDMQAKKNQDYVYKAMRNLLGKRNEYDVILKG